MAQKPKNCSDRMLMLFPLSQSQIKISSSGAVLQKTGYGSNSMPISMRTSLRPMSLFW